MDWGQNLKVGGKYPWFTLNKEQWEYLLKRKNTSGQILAFETTVYEFIEVEPTPIKGIMILPDDVDSYDIENITALTSFEEKTLREAGAAFLPYTGLRQGNTVMNIKAKCYYWLATENGSDEAFNTDKTSASYHSRYNGYAVRLVAEFK